MSACSFFHNLMWKFSAFGQFSGYNPIFNAKLKLLLLSSSFLILILITAHDLKLFRKREKYYLFSQAITRYCMIYFGSSPKIGFRFFE